MLNQEEFIDLYIKEVTEAAHEEEASQDYFEFMSEQAERRYYER